MTEELFYTSAPKGLQPGVSGFCTVARTRAMPAALQSHLEGLSTLSRPGVAPLPVHRGYCRVSVQGQGWGVLSRVCDAGSDHTGRTNSFAHHIAFPLSQAVGAGPAAALSRPGVMEVAWRGEPRWLERGRALPAGAESAPSPCAAWARLVGDAGWAGALVDWTERHPDGTAYLVHAPGLDVLPLFEDALRLYPPAKRWLIGFGTQPHPDHWQDYRWRGVMAGGATARAIGSGDKALVIDLTRPMAKAVANAWVERARTGKEPEPVRPVRAPTAPTPARLAPDRGARGAPDPVVTPQMLPDLELALTPDVSHRPLMARAAGLNPAPLLQPRQQSSSGWTVGAGAAVIAIVVVAAVMPWGSTPAAAPRDLTPDPPPTPHAEVRLPPPDVPNDPKPVVGREPVEPAVVLDDPKLIADLKSLADELGGELLDHPAIDADTAFSTIKERVDAIERVARSPNVRDQFKLQIRDRFDRLTQLRVQSQTEPAVASWLAFELQNNASDRLDEPQTCSSPATRDIHKVVEPTNGTRTASQCTATFSVESGQVQVRLHGPLGDPALLRGLITKLRTSGVLVLHKSGLRTRVKVLITGAHRLDSGRDISLMPIINPREESFIAKLKDQSVTWEPTTTSELLLPVEGGVRLVLSVSGDRLAVGSEYAGTEDERFPLNDKDEFRALRKRVDKQYTDLRDEKDKSRRRMERLESGNADIERICKQYHFMMLDNDDDLRKIGTKIGITNSDKLRIIVETVNEIKSRFKKDDREAYDRAKKGLAEIKKDNDGKFCEKRMPKGQDNPLTSEEECLALTDTKVIAVMRTIEAEARSDIAKLTDNVGRIQKRWEAIEGARKTVERVNPIVVTLSSAQDPNNALVTMTVNLPRLD